MLTIVSSVNIKKFLCWQRRLIPPRPLKNLDILSKIYNYSSASKKILKAWDAHTYYLCFHFILHWKSWIQKLSIRLLVHIKWFTHKDIQWIFKASILTIFIHMHEFCFFSLLNVLKKPKNKNDGNCEILFLFITKMMQT